MWLILQQEKPVDYVIATGVQHTVREFTTLAFAHSGIDLEWRGTRLEEKGYDKKTGKILVCVNSKWFRPTNVVNLLGDPTKARTNLGWDPQRSSYEELCTLMAEHDLLIAKKRGRDDLMNASSVKKALIIGAAGFVGKYLADESYPTNIRHVDAIW